MRPSNGAVIWGLISTDTVGAAVAVGATAVPISATFATGDEAPVSSSHANAPSANTTPTTITPILRLIASTPVLGNRTATTGSLEAPFLHTRFLEIKDHKTSLQTAPIVHDGMWKAQHAYPTEKDCIRTLTRPLPTNSPLTRMFCMCIIDCVARR